MRAESRREHSVLTSPAVAALLIVAVAVATRIVAWWNPVAHVDDQFYLLAGEELLNGRWPYVDVWDRKPLGLFLLYAGIALVGGGTILGLNLVATAFAATTAWVIRQIALRFASPASATLAAITYLVVLPLYGGQNGQSPVFYNLLMAAAAWLLLHASDGAGAGAIRRDALAAMLLCGLSMTIKQVSFVEGAFFGLAFLWLLRRQGSGWPALAATGAAMILVALLPTALSLAGYALGGQAALEHFIYANFVSIFQRQSWSVTARLAGFGLLILYLFPLFIMSAIGAVKRWSHFRHDRSTWLLIGWIAAALLGYLSVPAFFDHYALPLIPPLAVAAAIFFDTRSGPLFFSGYLLFCLIEGSVVDWSSNRRDARLFGQLETVVNEARHDGCIYVADGPSRLYSTAGSCRLTRYLFPDHLHLITEQAAVGVDAAAELARIMARRPAVIVTKDRPKLNRHTAASRIIMSRALRSDYRMVAHMAGDLRTPLGGIRVWQRNDLADRPRS